MSWTNEEIESTLRAVTERSITDGAFRAVALSNPAAAIAQVTNKPVPEGFRIQFVDNAKSDLTIVLPDALKAPSEVSEEELAGVAGGGFSGPFPTLAVGCSFPTVPCVTQNNLTACNPLYTKKPNSPTLCP